MSGRWLRLMLAWVGAIALGACSDSARPLYVDSLSTTVDSVFLGLGESTTITFQPRDNRGEALSDRQPFVRVSTSAGSTVSISDTVGAEVILTGVAVGSASVTAALGRGSVTLPVHVSPPGLASIEIVPNPIFVPLGDRVRVDAVLRDAAGEVLSAEGFRFTWTFDQDPFSNNRSNAPFTEIFGSSALVTATLSLRVSRFTATAAVTRN